MKRKNIVLTGVLCAVVALSSQLFTAAPAHAAKKQTEEVDSLTKALQTKYKGHKTKVASPKVGKKVFEAYDLYSADQVKEALAVLKDINAKTDFDKAYVDRFIGSLMAGEDGKAKEAIQYIKGAVAPAILNPREQADGLKLLGDLQMQERMYKDAIASYQSWMDYTGTEHKDIYLRMAQAQYETGNYAEMIPLADRGIAISPKPDKNLYILKLTSYYERKQYKNSVKVLEQLVSLFPEDQKWWAQLGQFYMLIDDYEKALATMDLAYKKGLFTKQNHYKALSQLFYNQGIPYKAAVVLEKHMDKGDVKRDDKMLSQVANAYRGSKNYDKAAKYYGEAAKLSGDGESYRKQASMYLMMEEYNLAIKAGQNAIKSGVEKTGSVNMMIAEAYLNKKNLKQAHAYAVRATKDRSTAKTAKGWASYIKSKAQQQGVKL
ncbi:tetratricopeptide repeat protein [Neiella marina]|uniref:Tetratricopeptide repeat protein n=1 Tax=Neiella holothuriorum TaxID=2870530 RepID=A0ABS7EF02_9GAMM|nr:tetratricopeptide repeat protein [Neiella holothuriorum]MBW8190906.1 tetratricopeptide repeat protein [Neiella holothuriorum]